MIIIGAGMGGLSAALRLAHAGHQVTIVEKNARVGGKVNVLEREGFRFDTGPTILTMPQEIEQLFRGVGRDPAEYVELHQFTPIYRAHFRDGTIFELHTDERDTLEEIARISPSDVANYQHFMRRTERIWEAIDDTLFDRLFLSWRDIFQPDVFVAGLKVDALRSMYSRVDSMFDDPRIKQLFMFQAIYVGASPRQTPATYTVIPYLEQQQGVWFPRGGLYTIVEGAVRVAEELGVELRCGTPVAQIRVDQGRATGVELESGSFLPADVVISNADVVHTYGDLVPASARKKYSEMKLRSFDPSSSAFIIYLAVEREYPELAHHNIYFGGDYDQEMVEIFEEKRMPRNGSWYICAPTRTDPGLAPPGCEALYLLTLAPALSENSPDWEREQGWLVERMLDRLEQEAGLADIRQHIRWSACFTPKDFESVFNGNRGSIFGLSAITQQSAFLRPPNRSEDVRALYLVGGSTQPGGGVPIVMISGRLVAELIERDLRDGLI
ncbi:MAG: phytoene desaturase family protein [Chloroflexota bacterium]|nr:phytoene desaturase family protein [Chloroflexota bacterium]